MTMHWLLAAALIGLGLIASACSRPQPFGEDIWRGVKQIQQKM